MYSVISQEDQRIFIKAQFGSSLINHLYFINKLSLPLVQPVPSASMKENVIQNLQKIAQ